jgi:hypothetical protein
MKIRLVVLALTAFATVALARIPPAQASILQSAAGTTQRTRVNDKTITFDNRFATLQLAVDAACDGTTPGTLILPKGTITIKAELLIRGSCTISGQDSSASIIQASADLISPDMAIQSVSNVTIKGVQINGNRSANAFNVDCIDIVDSKAVVFDSTTVTNCNHDGILITGSSSQITVINSEISNCGPMDPGIQGQAGILVGIISSGSAVSRVTLKNNRIHDNNTGFSITNTEKPGLDMTDFVVAGNRIFSNANDGILITTAHISGGNISKVSVENNEIYCNGWPADGVEFSPRCTTGLQQKGHKPSQGGVGVDLIQSGSARLVRPIVEGNTIHDNVFEGVASTTTGDANTMPRANIAGKSVTWISGPLKFDDLSAGQYVLIEGKMYAIASVTNSKFLLLQTSAGNLVDASIAIPAFMGASIRNNTVSDSGNGSRMVGPCFYNQLADGNTYSGNTANRCALEGFEDYMSNSLSYTGDKAYGNGRSKAPGRTAGFAAFGCSGITYRGIETNDTANPPTQTIGVLLDSTVAHVSIQSQRLYGSTPVQDKSGTATLNGKLIVEQPNVR